MKEEKIILNKGEKIEFLDYTIRNSKNNDGLVLYKTRDSGSAFDYETHLGNFGPGTANDILNAKQAALVYYMLARPAIFATSIMQKIMSGGSQHGTYHEWYLLKHSLIDDKIYESVDDFPDEIKEPGDGMNMMIYFNGKPLKWIKEK
jgi:hypothetical protein